MPRLTSPTSSRPFYFDRDPLAISQNGSINGLAPHANTVRVTYTVPTDRKSFTELLQAEVAVETAAGTPSSRQAFWRLTPDGGSGFSVMTAQVRAERNTAGDGRELNAGASIFMAAGDVLEGRTLDGGTTGTAGYVLIAKHTEFDA